MIPIPSQIIATEPLPKETLATNGPTPDRQRRGCGAEIIATEPLPQAKVVIGQEFTGKSRIDIKSIRATELVAHWIASDP